MKAQAEEWAHRCVIHMTFLAYPRPRARRKSKPLFASSPRNTTPTKARSRKRKSVSRRSARPTRFLAKTRSAKRSIAARSTRKASRARRNSKVSALAASRGAVPATFAISASISAPAGLLAELCGAGRTRGRSQAAAHGEDIAATIAVPLTTIAQGGSARVILPTGKSLDVAVPAGIEEGKSIRLRGQGHPARRGGSPGDVIVTIRYLAHPLFKVEGRDLRLDLPITLYEAILGARVRAPTLSGEVEVSVAPGSNGGRVLRLRGKGLPGGPEQAAGDLLATLRIVLPNEPDAELTALMQKMRDQKPYQPRSGMG